MADAIVPFAAVPARPVQLLGVLLQQEEEQPDAAALALLLYQRRIRRRRKQFWVRPWITRRVQYGDYDNLMVELERESQGDFTNFLRMEPAMFHELVQRLTPRISKQDTQFRRALEPGLKLAVTLRFLATGNSFHSLSYSFRVPHNSISIFVREVLEAIIAEFGEEVVVTPTIPEGWRELADKFSAIWNFHHTLGALDGKHIAIKAPPQSGSVFYNYKGFFSIILLGLVDADYKFIWVDVGANGSTSDCAVFNQSELKDAVEAGALGIPDAEPLPGDDHDIPYFFVGDDAFALSTWMMNPFSARNFDNDERIFNYRLSRARRIVENAFGILAHRFQCLLTTLQMNPEAVQTLVMACIFLHRNQISRVCVMLH
jgi:hypothetical protein